MATNKASRDSMVVVAVVVALVVTVMANLLADKKFARVDLTAEGRYSLSKSFLNILGRLEDTLKVTYYVSEKAPVGFEKYRRDMLDKLHEIELAGKGKIVLEVIDPTEKKELRERLEKDGFEFPIMVYQKDQEVQAIVFTGLELLYEDKPKIQLQRAFQAEGLEYMLGSKIIELTTKKKPVIAVSVPPSPPQNPQMAMMGQKQQGSGYEWLSHGQWDEEKKFEVKNVELNETNSIPPEAALLIMVRPKTLTERQKYEITKYLASGGRLLLVAAPFKVSYEFGWRVEKSPTGLEDYLKELGINIKNDFIADNANLRMVRSINLFTGEREEDRIPFFVKILPENIDQESVLTKLMPGLVAPFPAAIELDGDKLKKNGLREQVLARTSKQSWVVPFTEAFDPKLEMKYDESTQHYDGQRNVFVMLEGQFPFPYEGKQIPEWNAAPRTPEDKDKKPENAPTIEKKPGSIAIISSPDAFHMMLMSSRELQGQLQGNYSVIPNMAENFSMGEDLIRLRTKRYETRVIKGLGGSENDFKRNALKLGLLFGMPILVLIVALTLFFLRRASQTGYERKFAQTIGPSSFSP
jgi:ABC-type uncharacterized transport system involved in gliding motility auxiliary subunit